MPNPKREIMCCLRCGRDTRAMDGLCAECGGRLTQANSREKLGKGRPSTKEIMPMDYEDDYGEESGPDDVRGGVE